MTQEMINELLTVFYDIGQEDGAESDSPLRNEINAVNLDRTSAARKNFDEAVKKLNCADIDGRTIGRIEDTALSMFCAGEDQGFIKGFIYARGLLRG